MWLCLAGLGAGIAYGYGPGRRALVPVLVLAACALLRVRRRPYLAVAGMVCLALSFGILLARARLDRAVSIESVAKSAPLCRFEVRALESEGGLGTLSAVESATCDDRHVPSAALVWMERDVPPGSRLVGEGWLVPLGEDGFGRARRRFGSGAELVVDRARLVPPEGGSARLAHDIRNGLVDATSSMRLDRAALLRGLTTGDTSLFDDSATEEFRASGLSHLVAVSGQNVAIVLGAVAVMTRGLGARARLVLALAGVALYVVVVGPEPSVLRAAAMAMIVLAGLGFGSRAEPWHLLALALIVVIALRPAVLYSAGLHLSAAATAGLLLWARPLARRLGSLPDWAALTLGATLAAQFAVMPLIAGLFGSVSLSAPVANVLALPAVPPATVLGLGAALTGAVHPEVGRIVAAAAEPFVAWIVWIAHAFGGHAWAAADVPTWTAWPLGALVLGMAARTGGGRVWRPTLGSLE